MNQTKPSTNNSKKFYIAGMGMITPVGGNVAMTATSVAAGISGYKTSPYYTEQSNPITMAQVPVEIFAELEAEIDEGDFYNEQHDHIIKMAILAIREACSQQSIVKPIPLVLAMPELESGVGSLSAKQLIRNLIKNCAPWLSTSLSRNICSGRASGMEAIDFAFTYLYDMPYDFLLVGGSDAFCNYSRLRPLDKAGRLLTTGSADSFAPGEGAGFLLLTRNPDLAQVRNNHIIALNRPGIADELGHLYSEAPYRGEGLDNAFKKALIGQQEKSIHSIYSSMNGENHWAKEYGVAFLRNRKIFHDPVRFEHPADCYGDLGSATSTTLIALAAEHLFKSAKAQAHLVYSSSDTATRGAIVVEKMAVTLAANNQSVRNF
jgi:3-oxoacyl-[acyl-carrier-protein] synthase I